MEKRVAAALWLLCASHACAQEEDIIKLPVEVDQQGKTIYFVTHAASDVAADALTFCSAHLPTLDAADCASNLEGQVALLRKERAAAAAQLPGLSFTVNNAAGETIKFVHEEGASPADEARHFCREHFEDVDESSCIDAMLQNAKRALDEINARHAKTEL